ncbi:MAG: hypothetical protein MUE73_20135 [Planctomycetes bacterium]|jgi:hypothetical protein|nr:hypothetical protein [Planctomycetota bacterium]
MKEMLFILPILATIALVLGATRGEVLGKILREAGRSFAKLVVGIAILCVVLQGILLLVAAIA